MPWRRVTDPNAGSYVSGPRRLQIRLAETYSGALPDPLSGVLTVGPVAYEVAARSRASAPAQTVAQPPRR